MFTEIIYVFLFVFFYWLAGQGDAIGQRCLFYLISLMVCGCILCAQMKGKEKYGCITLAFLCRPLSILSQISNVQWVHALIFQKRAAWQGTISLGETKCSDVSTLVRPTVHKPKSVCMHASVYISLFIYFFLVWLPLIGNHAQQLQCSAFCHSPFPAATHRLWRYMTPYGVFSSNYNPIICTVQLWSGCHKEEWSLDMLTRIVWLFFHMRCVVSDVCARPFFNKRLLDTEWEERRAGLLGQMTRLVALDLGVYLCYNFN